MSIHVFVWFRKRRTFWQRWVFFYTWPNWLKTMTGAHFIILSCTASTRSDEKGRRGEDGDGEERGNIMRKVKGGGYFDCQVSNRSVNIAFVRPSQKSTSERNWQGGGVPSFCLKLTTLLCLGQPSKARRHCCRDREINFTTKAWIQNLWRPLYARSLHNGASHIWIMAHAHFVVGG